MKKLLYKQKGFTIIEVLIVLAIAGLIMLIVFLAVPALQRNSRNTQRNSDAASILAAVNECLGNKNGVSTSCDQVTDTEISLDINKLGLLKDVQASTWAGVDANGANGSGAGIWFNYKCTPDGASWTQVGATNRNYMILYRIETSSGSTQVRCIDS